MLKQAAVMHVRCSAFPQGLCCCSGGKNNTTSSTGFVSATACTNTKAARQHAHDITAIAACAEDGWLGDNFCGTGGCLGKQGFICSLCLQVCTVEASGAFSILDPPPTLLIFTAKPARVTQQRRAVCLMKHEYCACDIWA